MHARDPEIPAPGMEHSADGDAFKLAPRTKTEQFYSNVLAELLEAALPFMVGGGYAVNVYTDARRPTKDLDVFTTQAEFPRLLAHLQHNHRISASERWLGKVHRGRDFVDVIFDSSNGAVPVQQEWFQYARQAQVLGHCVPVISPTELIWSKVFIQKRNRHDGSDIVNLILRQRDEVDWRRLIAYMDPHWEVLLCHLLTFRWIYPSERDAIPGWLFDDLLERLNRQREYPPPASKRCRGRLFSSSDYRSAIEKWGFLNGEDD
ncbi:nucleotidyltransferase family protein [Bradyrhizobium sp. 139]|uniref:nucleotidyltransferase family protein n=1 Tax=Bradyrhizobium sp. 139 TaxID=2782616 RepID=UPI001FFB06F4